MIEVATFQTEHLEAITPREVYKNDISLKERFEEYSKRPSVYSYTLISDGIPVAVFMGNIFYGRICDVIAIVSDKIEENKFGFVRACKKLMKATELSIGIDRFQITVHSDFKKGCRFAEVLGFKKEGVMQKYGPDSKDYYLYARVI